MSLVFSELLLSGVGKSSTVQRKESEHCLPAQERVSNSLTLQKPVGRIQEGEEQVHWLSMVEIRKAWNQGPKREAEAHWCRRSGNRVPESEQGNLQPVHGA